MWLHPVSVKENVQTYISPKLCLTSEIKSKYFRTGECVGIGQTTVSTQYYFPFALFGGKVKGINRRGGGALFCDFASTKWSAFILILMETILKGKNLQPLGANSFL